MGKNNRAGIFYIILIIVVLAIVIGFLYYLFKPKSHNLFVSGRIEGYEVDISPKYAGIISYIIGREGKCIKKGDLLVKIEDNELQAQLQESIANIETFKQQQIQAKLQINVIKSQIKQAKLTYSQSSEESQASVKQAQASLSVAVQQFSQAQELLNQANFEQSLAQSDMKRYTNLIQSGSVSRQVLEQAQTRYNTARSVQVSRLTGLAVSKNQIQQAEALLTQATSSRYNPDIRNEQTNLLYSQLKQAQSQFEATNYNLKKAEYQKKQIMAQISYFSIYSPINGVIINRTSEPGEIAATGKIILTLLNSNSVYLRGFIPEGKIGLVYVGQPACIYLDSSPKNAIHGNISEIDAQASFTPENIYFKQDRIKQVFGIKININNPKGFAKPGMPADGEIVLDKK